ncbi:MAG: hypothetical protein GWO20_03010, partial [Candidatus Korarchaeota archaeon]|nr:hypothetical protein [Candidatus Korarchaeota archaeon]
PENTLQTEKGYALLKEEEGNIIIKEMIALTKEDTAILIEKIEDKASGTVIARDVLDLKTLDVHKSHGYMTL